MISYHLLWLRSLRNLKRFPSSGTYKRWTRPSGAFGTFLLCGSLLITPDFSSKQTKGVSAAEVKQHCSSGSLWIAINGRVYDLTSYASQHPGGFKVLANCAGKDASDLFNSRHATDFPDRFLTEDAYVGVLVGELEQAILDKHTGDGRLENTKKGLDSGGLIDSEVPDHASNCLQAQAMTLPPLSQVLSPGDFEYIARKTLPSETWDYYATGTDDEVTLRENHNSFSRVFFRPRCLRKITSVDMTTTILGQETSVPFYCTGAAGARKGHEDGEMSIARACGHEGVAQMVTNFSSCPFDDIFGQVENQVQILQVAPQSQRELDSCVDYANRNQDKINALFVNADTPACGNRERHFRRQAQIHGTAPIAGDSFQVLGWDDIDRVQQRTSLPIGLKGVLSVQDIINAAERGIKAVVISNHGGRQLDFTRAPLEILVDAIPALREKGLEGKIEIYIDGGVRRGSDILKAVALGAKGVGLGRLFLYANAGYGEDGVKHLIQLLKQEIEVDMKLLGIRNLSELNAEHLDLRNLHARASSFNTAYDLNYQTPSPPQPRPKM